MKFIVDKLPAEPEECLLHKIDFQVDMIGNFHPKQICTVQDKHELCKLSIGELCPYLTILTGSDR